MAMTPIFGNDGGLMGYIQSRDVEPKKPTAPIPQGALFTITTGEYSDYSVIGVFRALVQINPDDLVAEWLKLHPEAAEMWEFKESPFLAHMVRAGMIEPVDSFEWYLGTDIEYMRVSNGRRNESDDD